MIELKLRNKNVLGFNEETSEITLDGVKTDRYSPCFAPPYEQSDFIGWLDNRTNKFISKTGDELDVDDRDELRG